MDRKQGTVLPQPGVEHGNPMDALLDKPHIPDGQTATIEKDKPEIRKVVKAYCDRGWNMWVLEFEGGATERVERAVLNKVNFACKLIDGVWKGCGDEDEYRGFCHGSLDPLAKVDARKMRRLRFDKERGAFVDALTEEEFFDAKQLILMKDCSARYVPTDKE